MDNFAIIKISGHQYIVNPGQVLDIARIEEKEGDVINLPSVLLLKENGKVTIGTPSLNIKATATVLKHFKGEKIEVFKYKSKVRYRRHTGFRPFLTKIQIKELGNLKHEPVKEMETNPKENPLVKKVKKTIKGIKKSAAKK